MKMLELNTIHNVDCVSGMSQLPAGSVDFSFADPPFNIGYKYDVYDDKRAADHYLDWSREWITAVHRALKPTGTFWLAIGDEFAAELKLISLQAGFRCRSWVIWYYTFGVNCTKKFSRSHVHLFHFVKDHKHFTFNSKAIRVPSARQLVYNDGRAAKDGRLPDDTWILRPQDLPEGFEPEGDTWYFPRVAGTFKERAGFHGCQMPEQLLGRIVRACSNEDELVLDPFSGSGTTLVVAKKLGRKWIGFDLSTEYVRRGSARLEAASVGEPLSGSPEPQVSAPATPKRIAIEKAGATHSPAAIRARPERTRDALREVRVSAKRQNDQSKRDSDYTTGITEAFRAAGGGFSVDRIVADDDLNAEFADACRKLGLSGTLVDWNRALFRLRKSGRLQSRRQTDFDWTLSDQFIFASEIALRQMKDKGYPLDAVLCDPKLRAQFDNTAREFAPGYSSFQYRWGAFRIRKFTDEKQRKKARLVDAPEVALCKDISTITSTALHGRPGFYVVSTSAGKITPKSALYAGSTLDLGQRLTAMDEGRHTDVGWTRYAKLDRLFVAFLESSDVRRSTWLCDFMPRHAQLIGKFDPRLNYSPLAG